MLNPRELDLSPLELALNGSEPVDAATMDRFAEAAGRYGMPATAGAAAYGLAECTLAVACTRRWDPLQSVTVMRDGLGEQGSVVRTAEPGAPGARRLVTCGRSDDATEIQILDASGKPLPPWHVGEIVVRGPSVMLGYWGDDEATSHALRAGRLHTGDLGFVTDELELVPCGRIKDMIIVAGRNLYPEDYEFVAEGVNGVRKGNAVAFSLPGSEHMVLVVETRLESDDASRLLGELGDSLSAEFDVAPSEILAVAPGTVPKTSSGKRERQRCRELYLAGELHPITSTAA
jgi:fatty-acyl-CoA synthase